METEQPSQSKNDNNKNKKFIILGTLLAAFVSAMLLWHFWPKTESSSSRPISPSFSTWSKADTSRVGSSTTPIPDPYAGSRKSMLTLEERKRFTQEILKNCDDCTLVIIEQLTGTAPIPNFFGYLSLIAEGGYKVSDVEREVREHLFISDNRRPRLYLSTSEESLNDDIKIADLWTKHKDEDGCLYLALDLHKPVDLDDEPPSPPVVRSYKRDVPLGNLNCIQ